MHGDCSKHDRGDYVFPYFEYCHPVRASHAAVAGVYAHVRRNTCAGAKTALESKQ